MVSSRIVPDDVPGLTPFLGSKILEQPVVIEYTVFNKGGQRVRREYPNSFKARQAYGRLDREGKQPQVVQRQAK